MARLAFTEISLALQRSRKAIAFIGLYQKQKYPVRSVSRVDTKLQNAHYICYTVLFCAGMQLFSAWPFMLFANMHLDRGVRLLRIFESS